MRAVTIHQGEDPTGGHGQSLFSGTTRTQLQPRLSTQGNPWDAPSTRCPLPASSPPPTPGYVWIGRVGPWPTAPGSWNPSQEHSQLSQLHLGATNKHCCLETPPRPSIPGLNHGTRATKSSLATIICPTLSFLRQED